MTFASGELLKALYVSLRKAMTIELNRKQKSYFSSYHNTFEIKGHLSKVFIIATELSVRGKELIYGEIRLLLH